MSDGMCSVDGCEKPVKRPTTGFCYSHYMKNWRYGTPTPAHASRASDIVGKRYGELTVLKHLGHGKWLCSCDCGETTTTRAGELNRGSAKTCGNRTAHYRQETVEYTAAHDRIRTDLGSVRNHACSECGAPARHWSYNHDDPHELESRSTQTLGVRYSLNPSHYSPRCVPCHKRFDLDRIGATSHYQDI
jgi:hypothetical protein